ncbi:MULTISPECIES: hypothetical protein [Mammaliicoccus]|uniref:Uncharacterized protein n=1 Tax=Mammaliicoccus sciuri TaxID=1296 RepID=A0ABT7HVD3_MAMSC|nr:MULTISPECIES: hypothetical protein [Mammaliicoccus]MBF9298171.1 hypothetical protein [Staphylococcus schleiferi]MCJ0913420.1 hypothetical protein [Mammaliicoccus sciuri]MCJ0942544.1 hypothetical protein [Mammaliicoccus sciuri]MDL0112496.1 hypothetical protein [Mammaliicoccus sciuri]MDL0116071.1 hypothetical protein [Mammaliicoccus sciuri]
MLVLKLVSKDEKSVTYDYYPENEKVSGRITISIEDCEILYAKKSEYDQDTSNYLGHAIYRIEKYIKNNEFPENDLVAWG